VTVLFSIDIYSLRENNLEVKYICPQLLLRIKHIISIKDISRCHLVTLVVIPYLL